MLSLMTDIRLAFRNLLFRPAFTVLAVFTLALGIGANTAMFSAMYHTIIRPLPFEDAGRIGYVWQRVVGGGGMMTTAPLEYQAGWRGQTQVVAEIGTYARHEFTLLRSGDPEVVHGGAMDAGILPMLRLKPLLGRNILPTDNVAGAPLVALISEGLWKSRFGGASDVLGQPIRLGENTHEIVGVVPNTLAALNAPHSSGQVWIAAQQTEGFNRSASLVRLNDGYTFEQASEELNRLSAGIEPQHRMPGKWEMHVRPLTEDVSGRLSNAFPILLGAVGLVLLIACANLAGLMLVRLSDRNREIAIRSVLGAAPYRIVRLIWAEALVLALMGAGAGVLIATWSIDLIRVLRPESLVTLDSVSVDRVSLSFAALLAIATTLMFGLAPALLVLRRDLSTVIGSAGGATARVTATSRMRPLLVTGEIAVSLVLLIGAGLFLRSMLQLQALPRGFDHSSIFTAQIELPEARYSTAEARRAFADQLLESVRAMTGVEQATMASGMPPATGMMFSSQYLIEGDAEAGQRLPQAMQGGPVSAEFFTLLRVPLVEGRVWREGETTGVIVSEEFARRAWPDRSAVGQRFRMDGPDWSEVIGVVPGIAGRFNRGTPQPQMWIPLGYDWRRMQLIVRTTNEAPLSIVPAVTQAMHRIDPTIPLREATTGDALMASTTARERFNTVLLGVFAGLALVLSLVGLFGVISSMVHRRRHEIGVRLALGATPGSVQALLLREGAVMIGAGLALGTVGAVVLLRVLRATLFGGETGGGLLFGVRSFDAATFVLAGVLLAGSAFAACWVPKRTVMKYQSLEPPGH